ncbi:MAG: YdeI/OmpD-associated family protein [Acidimicrobiia bacterium]
MPNSEVDRYIEQSEMWPREITDLRPILLGCGLAEEIKWGKPCYSHGGRNIAIVQEMKDFLALMFFKGALMKDPDGVLEDQGPNSRSARRICITTSDDVTRLADTIAAYVHESIAIEEAGLDVGPPPELTPPDELQHRLDEDPAFRDAFESLTPGRRREYTMYISSAKQSKTRKARVDKYAPRILRGEGMRDRPG